MKVALLAPIFIANFVEKIVDEQVSYVDLTTYIFEDFTKITDVVKNIQSKYDGIIFGGILSYYFAKNNLKEEIIWEYLPLHESCVLSVLFQAQQSNGKVKSISIDTYSMSSIEAIYDMTGITFDDVEVKLFDLDLEHLESFNERALEFHKKNLQKNKDICIVTALSKVHNILNKENIKNYMAIPTETVIKDTFQKAFLRYTAKVNKNSQLVSISIQIDLPSEYSLISKNEYYYIKEKNKLSELIYEFAQNIEAAVIEVSFNTFLMFTTKEILEKETKNFEEIPILNYIGEKSLHMVSLGIGYGKTAGEAKYNSNSAMIKSKEYNENTAFVIYEDGYIIGPIHANEQKQKQSIEEKIIDISYKTNIGVNKVMAIYNAIDKYKTKCFTSSELARYCDMPERTINRVLNKLEEFGYVEIVGKQFPKGSGRPKRVMKINI
ncbi:hypothetical protein [Intestinibacter sp.]|uniref:hypothetical protein n=1 Tax=Intestinibacter sp. TaxID=1965304 RepID=UPI002A754EFA|nr:hypothetical protein [Intestinibacter sp.]MDY2737575.1 hypothetical protein [Intestinibacter sp.]